MEVSMKYLCLFGLVMMVMGSGGGLQRSDGAGECGSVPVEKEAFKLAPCASAAQDEKAAVSDKCCLQVKSIGEKPSCLCAVMLSDTAKSAGVKPEIAMTIPKRCNLADRPVGLKCGGESGVAYYKFYLPISYFFPYANCTCNFLFCSLYIAMNEDHGAVYAAVIHVMFVWLVWTNKSHLQLQLASKYACIWVWISKQLSYVVCNENF